MNLKPFLVCWKFFLFVLIVSCSITLNVFVAVAASIAPGDRQQLDSISRETGTNFTSNPSRDTALNDSHATISSPPAPPRSGTSSLPLPSAPEVTAPPSSLVGPGR